MNPGRAVAGAAPRRRARAGVAAGESPLAREPGRRGGRRFSASEQAPPLGLALAGWAGIRVMIINRELELQVTVTEFRGSR